MPEPAAKDAAHDARSEDPAKSGKRWVVFFDIGQVLVKYDAKQVAGEMARLLGRHPMRVARYLWSSDIVERVERGQVKPRELYRLFCRELGYEGGYEDFKRLWSGFFKPHPETAELFERLSRRHRVYLLSNTNFLHWRHIQEHYAFARKARGAVLSFKLGLRKPDPRIYRFAVRYAGAKAQDCIFIDDRRDNVEAAVKVGLRGIRFSDPRRLREELEKLGAL